MNTRDTILFKMIVDEIAKLKKEIKEINENDAALPNFPQFRILKGKYEALLDIQNRYLNETEFKKHSCEASITRSDAFNMSTVFYCNLDPYKVCDYCENEKKEKCKFSSLDDGIVNIPDPVYCRNPIAKQRAFELALEEEKQNNKEKH